MPHDKSSRLKVLFIQASPGGGSMIALYELLRLLSPKIEAIVLCYYKTNAAIHLGKLEGIRVRYLKNSYTSSKKDYWFDSNRFLSYLYNQYNAVKNHFGESKKLITQIYNVIKEEKPILVHHNNDIPQNRDAVRAAVKAGVKQVIHNRSLSIYRNNYIDYLIDLSLSKKINWYINISAAVQKHYKNLFQLNGKKCSVIYDVIDTEYFKENAPVAFSASLGIGKADYVITSIGRITPWKGQHVLIKAIAVLKEKLSNVKVLIAGSYEAGIGSTEYYNHLKKIVAIEKLEHVISFIDNRNDVAELINYSDVIVHTAVKPEPQGLVIIEALLCKKPVIASDAGGAAEIVKAYGGMLAKPGDVNELADLLEKLIANKHKSSFDFGYPLQHAKLIEDFEGAQQVASILDIYERVCEN